MSVSLPKLDLIKFNGNFDEWSVFYQQFAVNSNERFVDTTKFNYLKSALLITQ